MKPTVAVLRGGPSSQYARSLATGAFVLKALRDKYETRDIFIDKKGAWHWNGVEVSPQRALEHVDVVWNALHGEYGEDGKVQRILNTLGMRYTGPDPIAAARAMNKKLSKEAYQKASLGTPTYLIVDQGSNLARYANHIFLHFYMPVVIKPVSSGGSAGVSIAKSHADIAPSLEKALAISPAAIVEVYVPGKEVTCIVVEDIRGEKYYVPIPIEISYPKARDIFDEEQKNERDFPYHEALHFDAATRERIMQTAVAAHKALGLRHYSRSDMRVTPSGKVYILETNTVPVLHENSPTVQSLFSVGITPEMFVEHMVGLAAKRG